MRILSRREREYGRGHGLRRALGVGLGAWAVGLCLVSGAGAEATASGTGTGTGTLMGSGQHAAVSAGAAAQAAPSSAVLAPVRDFALADYLATAGLLGLYYAIEAGLDEPTHPIWTYPIPLIDLQTRALGRKRSRAARDRADEVSDHGWAFSTVYPVAIATVMPLALGRGFRQVLQLNMMNLQAYTVASILVRVPHKLIGRERPNVWGCRHDEEYSSQCGRPSQYVSFYGGHTAISMTGAGLACAHLVHAELFGGGLGDALGCAAALTAAGVVFVTRLQADKHWLSDQLFASAMGLGVGYGLPTLLYYRPFWREVSRREPPQLQSVWLPLISNEHLGASWAGMF